MLKASPKAYGRIYLEEIYVLLIISFRAGS